MDMGNSRYNFHFLKKLFFLFSVLFIISAVFSADIISHAEGDFELTGNSLTYEDYSYEVIPLVSPFNEYFYIKTDNPDPDSFRFVDAESVYAGESSTGSIKASQTLFADVKYEDASVYRVNGGYIATGSSTDGGVLKFQSSVVTGGYNVYNITTGETRYQKTYKYTDTDETLTLPTLYDVPDYLIHTYKDDEKDYFDNLSSIQSGFSSICLYSGASVLGKLTKSETTPYYGLSTSPHVDQRFYVQSPYTRKGGKTLLVSSLHPLRYDSIGFPSIMKTVATRLNPDVTVEWSTTSHDTINVTYEGVTKSYGGKGNGGGKGILEGQIAYWYSFDGSENDAAKDISLSDLATKLRFYGSVTVPDEEPDKLKWAEVRKTVGKDGAYVKLIIITSIFGGSTFGYTFMYDDGSTTEGVSYLGAIGYMSNCWYDGRYFNKWEYYYPGAKFTETVETESPSIVIKDFAVKYPQDGRTYYYNYNTLDKVEKYNQETGVWSGFTKFTYNSENKNWVATSILNSSKYKDGGSYKSMDDQAFIDACTITMDEALAMNLDANTNVEPSSYYIYDRISPPGTYYEKPQEATPDPSNPGNNNPVTPQGTNVAAVSPAVTASSESDALLKDKSNALYRIITTEKKPSVCYVSPGTNKKTSITVPDTVTLNGTKYNVTEIEEGPLKDKKKLTKVIIGKNVKKIKKNAFFGCTSLKTVIIKTTKLTKKRVGKNAFKKINSKAKIKVPKKKYKAYKKILKARGITGKKQKIYK